MHSVIILTTLHIFLTNTVLACYQRGYHLVMHCMDEKLNEIRIIVKNSSPEAGLS